MGAMDLASVFAPWSLGNEILEKLGITPERAAEPGFNLLRTGSVSTTRRLKRPASTSVAG